MEPKTIPYKTLKALKSIFEGVQNLTSTHCHLLVSGILIIRADVLVCKTNVFTLSLVGVTFKYPKQDIDWVEVNYWKGTKIDEHPIAICE